MSDAENVVEAAPTAGPEKYPLAHIGFGKYTVNGETYKSKKEALRAREALLKQEEEQDEFGDTIPEGIIIRDRTLEFRGSVMEVPMNEPYLPDGDRNPYYDRAWVYAWAAYNGTDIADKQARGYHIFSQEDLDEMVEGGKAPEHYLSLLRRDGKYLVYGDLILMRIPRVLWRQRQREKYERNLGAFKRVEKEQRDAADRLNIPVVESGVSNELTIRL